MTKQWILDSIIEQISYAHENFIVYAEDLEEIGRTESAEKLREIINDIENLRYNICNTKK